MPTSIYDNGGMIGATLDFSDTEKYVIGTTTGRATPVYVGGTTSAGTGTAAGGTFSITSLTGGVGTAPEEGDVIIVAYAIGSKNDMNVSITMDGSTDVVEVEELYANDAVDANLGVYLAVATATPPTTITPGSTGSTAHAGALAVHVWRNIDTATPIDVTTTTDTATNSALANPPSITTSTENAVVIAIGASGNDNATTPFTQGGDLYNFISIGGSDSEDATVGIGSIATTTPTTVDPLAFSIATTADYSWAAATVALRPKLIDVPLYGNFKNSGIWSLNAVLERQIPLPSVQIIDSNGVGAANTSISVPSHNSGDMLVVVIGRQSAAVPALLSGYTNVTSQGVTAGSLARSFRVQYRISDGTISSVSFPSGYASVFVLRNASSVRQSNVEFSTTQSTSLPIPVLTGADTTGRNLILAGSYNGVFIDPQSPAGFTAVNNEGSAILENSSSTTPSGAAFTLNGLGAPLTWIIEVE